MNKIYALTSKYLRNMLRYKESHSVIPYLQSEKHAKVTNILYKDIHIWDSLK